MLRQIRDPLGMGHQEKRRSAMTGPDRLLARSASDAPTCRDERLGSDIA
jgi:hypothetical protein